jgi:transcriptional regulator with XRE-family HTH domain
MSVIYIPKELIIDEEIETKLNIEKSTYNNIEKSTYNNIQKSTYNNIEKSTDNIEKSTNNNIEKSTDNNIEKSSIIYLQGEIIHNKDINIKLDICTKDENDYTGYSSEEFYNYENESEENESDENELDENINTKLFIGIKSDEIESITDSTQYSEKSSNFEFEMIYNDN